jgi:hypothetical protein
MILKLNAAPAALAKALGLGVAQVMQKITVDLQANIAQRTPVDTGRARSSWITTVDQPSDDVPPEGAGGNPPPVPVGSIDHKKTVFIVSNLDYIEALENGHSQQAPAGMVAVSIIETEAEVGNIVAQLRK